MLWTSRPGRPCSRGLWSQVERDPIPRRKGGSDSDFSKLPLTALVFLFNVVLLLS